jgi:hypothetical protein
MCVCVCVCVHVLMMPRRIMMMMMILLEWTALLSWHVDENSTCVLCVCVCVCVCCLITEMPVLNVCQHAKTELFLYGTCISAAAAAAHIMACGKEMMMSACVQTIGDALLSCCEYVDDHLCTR